MDTSRHILKLLVEERVADLGRGGAIAGRDDALLHHCRSEGRRS
jgi:hypothetical protein